MVVLGAEGAVVEDVEVGCLEGGVALEADEAATVVAACKAAVGG